MRCPPGSPHRFLSILFVLVVAGLAVPGARASDHETCLECHGDKDLTTQRGGEKISLYIDLPTFSKSVHKDQDCTFCHSDVKVDDLPHAETLQRVQCGSCHEEEQLQFDASIHGQALNRKAPYAPNCAECHGKHDILPPSEPASRTYKMNVPFLCGKCHREGAPVARTYDIPQHNILEHYSESIHGEGLFKKGLIVAAACADCHGNHLILPHTEPRSSISPRNIARTCMKCHARIEEVHVKVIRGEIWEKEPGAIPACTDCHVPHRVRKETMTVTLSDRDCLRCHVQRTLHRTEGGDTTSVWVDEAALGGSMHKNIPCVKCHSDIDPRRRRPCEPSGRVDCAACHAKVSEEYYESGHGRDFLQKIENAPYCTTCHGDHAVKSHRDDTSPTYRAAVPELCGQCHRTGGKASQTAVLSQTAAITDYSASVHGRGLTEKGLLPSAICIDCHGSHMILPHTDDRSSVFPRNVPATCGTCHQGIYKQYVKSVHYSFTGESEKKLPTCMDCHSSHTIGEVGQDKFMTQVTAQCGSCHDELARTYLETMHGKAYRLGYLQAAKCSDCHGAHEILAISDPHSKVGFRNIVTTCRQCHEDANTRFTGYLTHATHHDQKKYPYLFYTYWAMTGLLLGVFGFFGIHTLLWLPRSFRSWRERRREEKSAGAGSRYYVRRFTRTQRFTHLLVIVSFLSLALTGMMLKFSSMSWAGHLAQLLGGVRVAGVIHRTAAVMTFSYFFIHIMSLIRFKRRRRMSWRQLIFGPDSLMFNLKDVRDFWGSLRWFMDRGPRPEYGRWTYWEKFDYLAVFWGVAIIGASGLMLWFPEFFTRFLPGWFINVATIIHSDEALLAVGFIFTIHFFNTHLRPEAFPMDTVIFSGTVPLEEYKKDRPQAWAALRESGNLRRVVTTHGVSPTRGRLIRIFGFVALGLGVTLIILILYSVLFGYR